MIDNINKLLRRFSSNLTEDGFKPNLVIRVMRILSLVLIKLLRLHGTSRWSNEFIQCLDPKITIVVNGKKLIFRTGHGRLYWRATKTVFLEDDTNRWIDNFNENDIFYDVGANVGVYTLMAAKIKGVRTFAFEPDIMSARCLHENIFFNEVARKVVIFPCALSNYSGVVDFHLSSLSPGSALHSLYKTNKFAIKRDISVSGVSVYKLDELISLLKLPPPTKIKVDIDGLDIDVLLGAQMCLINHVKEVLVESESGQDESLIAYMTDCGFQIISVGEIHQQHVPTRNLIFRKNHDS